MPLLSQFSTSYGRGGVWQVAETADELCALHPRGESLRREAEQRFRNETRRMEFLAVRVLLHNLFPKSGSVAYFPSGRPYLPQSHHALSISHTPGYVAVLFSPTARVGIDIEQYGERVFRLRSRFVRPDETAADARQALLHWSAKETAFKLMDCEGVDFLAHLRVSGALQVQPQTHFQAHECSLHTTHPHHSATFTVCYWSHPAFMLTWAVSSDEASQ